MQPFIKLFLTVLLAHLLGDFPLQSSSMVRAKHQGVRAYLAHGALLLLSFQSLADGPPLASGVPCGLACRGHTIKERVMAKVIEFYVPKNLRNAFVRAGQPQPGTVIEFSSQAKRSVPRAVPNGLLSERAQELDSVVSRNLN
jgi:hypothetical protein